jgi:hypothetical protein
VAGVEFASLAGKRFPVREGADLVRNGQNPIADLSMLEKSVAVVVFETKLLAPH